MSIKAKDVLSAQLESQLKALGYNLRAARKRRKWSIEKVRSDIHCSKGTLEDAEKGKATVSLGVYVLLLDLYGFKIDFAALTEARNDHIGLSLADTGAEKKRQRSNVSPSDF